VLVENYRRGTLERVRLGYQDLGTLNPRLVYCSISGYGRVGPRADEPGYDFVIQAESGLMAITGEPEGEPMKLGVAVTDILTGMNATQAVLAALLARERTGRGQFIDAALLDSAIGVLANVATGYLNTGEAPSRYGNAHPTVVPYQIFPTRDGTIALAVGNDAQFRTLCERIVGRPELAGDERYRTARARVLNREPLIATLTEIFRRDTTAAWLERLRAAGVPAGQVRTVPEVFEAPEVAARRLVAEVPDARHGVVRVMRSPLGLAGTPAREPAAPPRLGEHTDEILREALGATDAEIARWRECGAVA
jgi:crotonobetainyl-CoA:carnitine CoA-transferase CaiB-like acyl-CoA transferase